MLPSDIRNRSEEVRTFVAMWEKIRTESLGTSGPFIWQLNGERSPKRWELVHPDPLEYEAYDLSKVPVGHLRNMFAHVVTEHDSGWFSWDFVDDLHENIRLELEARIANDRSMCAKPANAGQLIHCSEFEGQQQQMELDKPIDLDDCRLITLIGSLDDDRETEYIWPIAAPKLAANLSNYGETPSDHGLGISFGPSRFHRIGFNMEINPKRWGRPVLD